MKAITLLLCASVLIAVLGGCASGDANQPKSTAQSNSEDTTKFVIFDGDAQHSVTCTGIQEGRTADGRMKITANLCNRETRRIEIQANCVFKDEQGFATDEMPFRTVILDENATESVSFESFRKEASKYTVRVRQAR